MRRVIILLLLATIIAPMVTANNGLLARDDFVDINSPEQIIIHKNETLEIPITIQNTVTDTQTYTISLIQINSDLSTEGLPLQYTLLKNQVRQVKFTLTSDYDAPFGSTPMTLNLTTDYDSSFFEHIDINILVAPESDFYFGVNDTSQFIVDPDVRSRLAINITNVAPITDDITFSISTLSNWNWGWDMNQTSGLNAIERISPGQLCYVYFWIDIPPVIDGSPLLNTGPRFTLIATSGLDFQQDSWSFDLLMSEFINMTIDTVSNNLTLDPSENDRMSISVRNVGNLESRLTATLELIDEFGQPIIGVEQSGRIESNGWTVALFGSIEDSFVQPNQSKSFEVGFQAPPDYFGSLDIRVIIYPIGAISKTKTIDISAKIEWQRSGNIELLNEGCLNLLPGQSCQSELKIQNTGNAIDDFDLRVYQIPTFLTTSRDNYTYTINPNQIITTNPIDFTASQDVLAFENDDVLVDLYLSGTQTKIGEIKIPVKIAPMINWSLESLSEEIDSKGRLAIAMTLRNDGNAIDGLMVQLQCSHSTSMSFIPPNNAIIEEGVELPRSFEINDLPLGANFTIRAWAEIPSDQTSNGTMYLNTTIRSRFAPDIPFQYTSTTDYIGVPWQNEELDDSAFDFIQLATNTIQVAKSWSLIFIAVIISGLIINRSLKDRTLRKEDEALKRMLYQKQSPEKADDWMEKFNPKGNQGVEVIQSPVISSERFTNAFRRNAGDTKPVSTPPNEKLRGAASLVLDIHDKNQIIKSADDLLQSIESEGIATPNLNNENLQLKPFETSLTNRNDPDELVIVEFDSSLKINQSVPLPTKKIKDDDLDI